MVDALPWLKTAPECRMVVIQTQWGRCAANGAILLNSHLVKAPTPAIDYVLLHEQCHLVEHDHNPRFYNLLDRFMPDWRSVKERLDGQAEVILRGSGG